MVKYEDLPDPSDEPTQQRPSSPSVKDSVKFPPLSFLPNTCHWKKAYLKGKRLHYNWTKGVYTVVPLLRGHKKPVTAMACDGKSLKFYMYFVNLIIRTYIVNTYVYLL